MGSGNVCVIWIEIFGGGERLGKVSKNVDPNRGEGIWGFQGAKPLYHSLGNFCLYVSDFRKFAINSLINNSYSVYLINLKLDSFKHHFETTNMQ